METGNVWRWRSWALAFAAWTLLGLLEAAHSYYHYNISGDRNLSWGNLLGLGLSLWYAWALLAGPAFWLARHFPIEARCWPRRVALHLAAAPLFALAKIALDYPIIWAFYCPTPHLLTFEKFYGMGLRSQFHSYFVIYWALVGFGMALGAQRRVRERARRADYLELQLARARLQLVKMQLHPHFLFNTLNAISALIHADPEVADRMVARLGHLLRLALEHFGAEEVSLRRELEFLEAYLEIEQARFGPRLRVEIDAGPDVLGAQVPYLLLQPLVENSLRHGLSPDRGGRVAVRARRAGAALRLEVEDDGRGLPPDAFHCGREGVGLANTREHLRQLYGPDQALHIGPGPAGGVLVRVQLPLRIKEAAEAVAAGRSAG
jgi:two-component sensor histidine kinase